LAEAVATGGLPPDMAIVAVGGCSSAGCDVGGEPARAVHTATRGVSTLRQGFLADDRLADLRLVLMGASGGRAR
jgi:hypothetical protein